MKQQRLAGAFGDLGREMKVSKEDQQLFEAFGKVVEMWAYGSEEDRRWIIDHHHKHFDKDKAEEMVETVRSCAKKSWVTTTKPTGRALVRPSFFRAAVHRANRDCLYSPAAPNTP